MSNENGRVKEDTTQWLERMLAPIPSECHFRVHTALNVKVDPAWGFQPRINNDFHLLYVKSGKGAYTLNGEKEPLHGGKVIFVSPGFLHGSSQDRKDPPVILPLRFGLHNNSTGKSVKSRLTPAAVGFTAPDPRKYRNLFERVFHFHTAGTESLRIGLCGSLLYQILVELMIDLRDEGSVHDPRIEKVRSYINSNPDTRATLDELAGMAGLSRKYFARLFRKQVGVPPGQFLIQVRCKFAQHLLEDTGQSIQEIADTLDYPDLYCFSKQFKQVFGISPARYRKHRNRSV